MGLYEQCDQRHTDAGQYRAAQSLGIKKPGLAYHKPGSMCLITRKDQAFMPIDPTTITTKKLQRKQKSQKLPAWSFYPGDWFKDPGVQALDLFHRGLWFEILLRMHESEQRGVLLLNGKPMPMEALAKAIGEDKRKITDGITQLLDYGVADIRESDGALISRRMLRDDEQRRSNSEVQSQNGTNGGNPAFQKGKPNPYYNREDKPLDNPPDNPKDKPKITLSSSSSISSSISSSEEREEGDISTHPPPDPFEKMAEEALERPTGSAPWEFTNMFVNCGRRPMIKYPNLYFTVPDLAEVFRLWNKAEIPTGRFRDGFQMLKAAMDNKPGSELNAFKWAIGYVKKELLESLNAEVKLAFNRKRE